MQACIQGQVLAWIPPNKLQEKKIVFGEDYGRGQEVLREESRIVKFVFLLEMGHLGSQAGIDKKHQIFCSILK